MSGYDGEGTGVDFSGSGSEVADAEAPGQAAPGAGLSFNGRGLGLSVATGSGYNLAGPSLGIGVRAEGADLAPGLGDRSSVSASLAGLSVDRAGQSVEALNRSDQQTRATVQLLSQIPIIGPMIARAYQGGSAVASYTGASTAAPGASPSVSVFDGGNMEADRAALGSPVLDYRGSPMVLLDRPGFAPGPGRALYVAQAARAQSPTYAGTPAPSNAGALVLAGLAAFALGS